MAAAAAPAPTKELAFIPDWTPAELDSGPSMMTQAANTFTMPVPLLWLADSIPLWLLLLALLLLLLAIVIAGWWRWQSNRSYWY